VNSYEAPDHRLRNATATTPTNPRAAFRWEWRTFGERFVGAERRFAELAPERVQESVDLYLVARGADNTVKVRGGLMDVKHLERVDESGLEQWVPVLKAAFPLSAEDFGLVHGALGKAESPVAQPDYSLDDALAELVGTSGDVVAVEVRKRRVRYSLGGCMAELTEAHSDRGSACTIAVESEELAQVVAAVRELGLGSLPNVSYPRWLAMLVGLAPARFAVIDVGTNSVKFHVGERLEDGTWRTVVDRAEVTRLGEGLGQMNALKAEPMERTASAIAAMVDEALRGGALQIAAVGTAGLRIASNSAAFVDAVEARCGVRIEVIPGDEEARLAYVATTSALGLGESSLVVFDTGGGSSQFTFGRGKHVDERFSVGVGAARFTERFGLDRPVSADVLQQALDAIASDLARLDGRPPPNTLVGMGGALTNLAAVRHALAAYDPEIVQGTVLDVAEIDRQIELYRTATVQERRAVAGLQPNRAEVILAGGCIVRTVMGKLGADRVTVSDRGLRHGLLVERFGKATHGSPG
jgi:exopolyphosphatase/guanosine-5'-triphosphate,3'-diphosphate pyrophosphatase